MVWYKMVRENGTDWYSGTLHYEIGQAVVCPDYQATDVCGYGLHISQNPNDCCIGAKFPSRLLVVEPTEGLITIDRQRSKCRSLVVREEVSDPNTATGWDYTGACAFLQSISDIPYFRMTHPPKPEWKLFLGSSGDAARAAAAAAARATAVDAVWVAAVVAARVAARDAVVDALLAAAVDAVRAAAVDAVWDAAVVASLYITLVYLLSDHDGMDIYQRHARARWEVWQRGYGLLCDVNGTLYVYGVASSLTT